MENLISNSEYILVSFTNAKLDINGILSKLLDKSYLKYKILPDHWTIFNSAKSSHLGCVIESIISFGISDDGIWYDNKWTYKLGNDDYHSILDSIFYDEFIFLLSEDLIKFDDYEFLTMDKIWLNFEASYICSDKPYLNTLYNTKNLIELKLEYKKLVMEYHPDITGSDNDYIREITTTYIQIKKRLLY